VSIGDLVETLRNGKHLIEIEESVLADYELPWFTVNLARKTSKALLFKDVVDKEYPVTTNIYLGKIDISFHNSTSLIVENFKRLISILLNVSLDPSSKISVLASFAWISDVYPRVVGSQGFLRRSALEFDLTGLPAVRHTAREEHPVIKNPVILLSDPKTGQTILFSEPVQVIDEKTLLLHIPRSSKAFMFLEESTKHSEAINAAIIIGVSPYLQLVSKMDWLPWFNKYLLAGGLSGGPVNLMRVDGNLYVPFDAETIILGELVPGDVRPEGKMLYEDMRYYGGFPMPLVRAKALMHKPEPVFYTSITHPYLSDEYALNNLREQLMTEYVRLLAPDVSYLSFLSFDAYRTVVVGLKNANSRRAYEIGVLLFSLKLTPYLDTVVVVSAENKVEKVENLVSMLLTSLTSNRILYFENPQEEELLRDARREKVIVDATSLRLDYISERDVLTSDEFKDSREKYEKILQELRGE